MKFLGGNPLDQGDPGQAGGIPFSFLAILLLILLVGAGLWIFVTEQIPELFKVRNSENFKKWFKEFSGGVLAVLLFGSILALIAFILHRIGL